MSDDELDAAIDDVGVIARVTPEDKVRLVDSLKRKGHIVAMTGDGVNDAPALKRADIGIAMGITGTEVSKEAATMILTDDNFATIVKAVELGRGLYDNLTKYIRFQMGVLVGFIVTFLGASIFNIVGGVPFVPLQTLYVNFTTQVLQAIGLGYGRPARGPDEAQAAPRRRADPAAAAPDLGRHRGPRPRRGHARRDRVGGRPLREQRGRAHDGADDVRDQQRRLLAHHARRAALDLLARACSRTGCSCSAPAAPSRRSCSAPSSASSSGSSAPFTSTCHQWLVCIVVGLAIVPVSEAQAAVAQATRRRRRPATGEPQEGVPAVSPAP